MSFYNLSQHNYYLMHMIASHSIHVLNKPVYFHVGSVHYLRFDLWVACQQQQCWDSLLLHCVEAYRGTVHGRPQKFFQGGGKVDILLILFRLLTMQRTWTFTKRFILSTPQRKCPRLQQQFQIMRFVGSKDSFSPMRFLTP